jgi:ribosomal protein S18 acetylase RimI-like enzyme
MIRLVDLIHDAPRLAELEALLFENAMAPSMLDRELSYGPCFVIGSPVVAYALVREQPEVVDLLRLGVLPSAQGQGHGRKLLEHVIGLDKDTMLTVLKENTRALRLYKNAGFSIVGELRVDGALAWVMLRRKC